MSSIASSIQSRIPNGIRKLAGIFDKPSTQHATPPSDTPVWQFTKRYAAKFWSWLKKDNWKWVLATLIISGIVHILAVLNLPTLAPKSAWFRLQETLKPNSMLQVGKLDAKEPLLPLLAPDIRYAICSYDLANGPVTVRSPIPNELFSVAAYDQLGQNFYVISGQALQRTDLYLVVTRSLNTAEAEVSASEKSDDVVVINSATTKGIIMLRVPVSGPAYEASVEEQLKKATCSVEKQ